MKHQLLLFLMLIMPLSVSAYSNTKVKIDNIWYRFDNDGNACVSYSEFGGNPSSNSNYVGCYSGDIDIPEYVIYQGSNYVVKDIDDWAFYKCSDLTSVKIPSSVTSIGGAAFGYCSNLSRIQLPNSIKTMGYYVFQYCSNLSYVKLPDGIATIEESTFSYCTSLKSITIPQTVSAIGHHAFHGSSLEFIVIPQNVKSIGEGAFQSCNNLTSVFIQCHIPPSFVTQYGYGGYFSNRAETTLYVPKGCLDTYNSTSYWKEFKNILEISFSDFVTMGSAGVMTYCNTSPRDFSTSSVKAYIASGFSPSTGELLLTRVYKVPAGEGVLLKGEAGDYEVSCAETDMVYSNLLKGVVTATNVSPIEGGNTNFILANGNHGIGFYTLSEEGEIGAGKAYLQLPTSSIAAMSRAINMRFDDEEENESTGLAEIEDVASSANEYFDLQGRPIPASSLKSGIYIIRSANGGKEKKVFIK